MQLKYIPKKNHLFTSWRVIQQLKSRRKKHLHSNSMAAESVEDIGGACEIENQFCWAIVCHPINLLKF